LTTIWELIAAIPSMIKLLQAIQKGINEQKKDRKVADDIKTLDEAFQTEDPEKAALIINKLFNS
jgi:hypothetical protein